MLRRWLRRGLAADTAFTFIKVLFFGIMLLLLVYVGAQVYNAVLGGDADGLIGLKYRMEFMAHGGLSVDKQDGAYSQNVYVMSGHEDQAMILFGQAGQEIQVENDIALWKDNQYIYKNPLDSPAICRATIGSLVTRSMCEPLLLENVTIVRQDSFTKERRAFILPAQVSTEKTWASPELYPQWMPSETYAGAFLPFLEADEGIRDDSDRPYVLYLEYFPGTKDLEPVFLVTPYDDTLRAQSGERRELLSLCRSGPDACREEHYGAALSAGRYCRAIGRGQCRVETAEECTYGQITETCVCDGESREDGFCITTETGQEWYDPEEIERESCEALCDGGTCDAVQEHACIFSINQESQCVVENDGCAAGEVGSQLIAEVARGLLSQGEGYRYVILDLPAASHESTTITDPGPGHAQIQVPGGAYRIIGLNADWLPVQDQYCETRGANGCEAWERIRSVSAACAGQSCICVTTETDIDAFVSTDYCRPIGNALVIGDSEEMQVARAGAYINTGVRSTAHASEEERENAPGAFFAQEGTATGETGISQYLSGDVAVLVEVLVKEGIDIVRVTQYDSLSKQEAARTFGCTLDECPP